MAARKKAALVCAPHARGDEADRLLGLLHAAGCASRRLRALLASHLEPHGISDAECLVLWLTSDRSQACGWAQNDLAAAVGVSPAQMSSLVERLRQRGLMDMKRATTDRRRQVWHLLDQGEELLGQIRLSLGTVAEELDALIPPEEQRLAQSLCNQLATDPASITTAPLRLHSLSAGQSATAEQGGQS